MMRAWLDANAGTPLLPEVQEVVAKALRDQLVNPSGYSAPSRAMREQVEAARAEIAAALGADPVEIIFTSGGSESINTALASATQGRTNPRVITSNAEHAATRSALELCTPHGAEFLPVDGDARLPLERFDPTGADLVSLIWANNEVGTINDVTAIDAACGKAGVPLHLDAVCPAGKLPINLHELSNLTYASFSAHKFHGLTGVGLLYLRRGTRFTPLIAGGHQERGRRAGTENLLGILAMAAALRGDIKARAKRMLAMRDRFERGLLALGGATIHAQNAPRLPNTTSVAFAGQNAVTLLEALDQRGVSASAGSACTTGSLEPSPVLRAMGLESEMAKATLRFSNSCLTPEAEIDHALNVLSELLATS